MNSKTLKAISYITSVAAEEWTLLQWLSVLTAVYPDGIPEAAKMTDSINFFVVDFPNFEQKAEDDSQEGLDKLYDEFVTYIFDKIK